jgi:hypothetical protein
MLGFGWLAVRQVQAAVAAGRLEEARRLFFRPAVRRHPRYRELQNSLALALIARSRRKLERDKAAAAWQDLLLAEQTEAAVNETARLRNDLSNRELERIHGLLDGGELAQVLDTIDGLRDRSVSVPELGPLEEAAREWLQAQEEVSGGDFGRALGRVEHIRALLPGRFALLEELADTLKRRQGTFGPLLAQLREAYDGQRWPEVVALAEQVLALAPAHSEASRLRSRAYRELQPATDVLEPPAVTAAGPREVPVDAGQRFLLWVDGVGGYLVCLGERITLGQATADTYVDVPLCADVSRLHAVLTREGGSYLLEGVRPVLVNAEPVDKAILQSNDRVTLGNSFQFQFRQPVPVSASARLDLVSGHRLPLAVDAVLLMADTLVFGPGTQAHVSMPDVSQPVVLFRQKDGLGVRHAGALRVDGRACHERANLLPGASVAGTDFAFALEPVGPRLGRM